MDQSSKGMTKATVLAWDHLKMNRWQMDGGGWSDKLTALKQEVLQECVSYRDVCSERLFCLVLVWTQVICYNGDFIIDGMVPKSQSKQPKLIHSS